MERTQNDGAHDFDFIAGAWRVHHRYLKRRLAGSDEWERFEGTCTALPLMDGRANVDDNVLELPAGAYRAVSLRSFDPASCEWSIWWLDGRTPTQLDTPVRGRFEDGIGTFFADDLFAGRPIKVRFIWSHITPRSARWQQAFSTDGGMTWETNWVMELERVGEGRVA